MRKNSNTNWKQISIELNFRNFVENLEKNDYKWDDDRERILKFTDGLKDHIENLKIRKLKLKKMPKSDFPIVNYPSDECEHVSLEFLKNLINLKTLSVEFGPGIVNCNYNRKLFQVATKDIENLSLALVKLKALQKLEIKHSDLKDNEKIFHLLISIEQNKNLTELNFKHCKITSDESGMLFERFLSENSTIEMIELSENRLNFDFCKRFAEGLIKFKGHLKYLGLAFNPIMLDGLKLIISSVIKRDNIKTLNVSCCEGGKHDSYEEFTEQFCTLLQNTKHLKLLDFSSNLIPDAELRKKIVNAHCKNSIVFFLHNPQGNFKFSHLPVPFS